MNASFGESTVESFALAWLEASGRQIKHRLDLAPGEPAAERTDYRRAVLEWRDLDALVPQLISGQLRAKDAEHIVGWISASVHGEQV